MFDGMEASQIMTRQVLVVPPELPLEAAWRTMQRRRVRHLLVTSAGTLLGILSDRDILLRATLADDGAVVVPFAPVATAMTLQPITCSQESSIASIASTMIDRRLDAVPVMSSGDAVVGLVTSTDLLALLTKRPPEERLPFRFSLEEARDA